MEGQQKDPADMTGREIAESDAERLRRETKDWVEAKGITTCPLCEQENAWDFERAVVISPFTSRTIGKIHSSHQGGNPRKPPGPERILTKIRDAAITNLRALGLVKLTCENCYYTLLLDHRRMREEPEEGVESYRPNYGKVEFSEVGRIGIRRDEWVCGFRASRGALSGHPRPPSSSS